MRRMISRARQQHSGQAERVVLRASNRQGSGWLRILLLGVLLAGCAQDDAPSWHVPGGNADSGELLIAFYGCGSCHVIPGIRGATGVVGPPLTSFGRRSFIAGAVPNEPKNLITWIVDPQAIEPGTAMPSVGATPTEARDIAAYLYTLN